MQNVQVLAEPFVRVEGFDCQAYVREHLGKLTPRWQIEVEFHAPLSAVRQKIPASFGSLTATPAGVLFQGQHGDIADTARYLIGLNLPFVVHQPQELRDALLRLAEQMVRSATADQG
jgi:hypothetical protein